MKLSEISTDVTFNIVNVHGHKTPVERCVAGPLVSLAYVPELGGSVRVAVEGLPTKHIPMHRVQWVHIAHDEVPTNPEPRKR